MLQILKEHIISRIAVIILVAALLTPSLVKFSHAYANHEHEVCVSNSTKHIHKVDLDCEFYKFKKTNEFYFNLYHYNSKPVIVAQKAISFYYVSVNSYQQSIISLRGPPQILV